MDCADVLNRECENVEHLGYMIQNPVKKTDFAHIPEWAISEDHSIYNLVTAVCLAGYEDKPIRLSADTQRRMLGKPLFGKRKVIVHADRVVVIRKVAFGQDYDALEFRSADDLKEALEQGWLM